MLPLIFVHFDTNIVYLCIDVPSPSLAQVVESGNSPKISRTIILGVGRLVYYKGFEASIQAMREIDATYLLLEMGYARVQSMKQGFWKSTSGKRMMSPLYLAADFSPLVKSFGTKLQMSTGCHKLINYH